jgi:hypothetical protein
VGQLALMLVFYTLHRDAGSFDGGLLPLAAYHEDEMSDPIVINTVQELENINNNLSGNYVLRAGPGNLHRTISGVSA